MDSIIASLNNNALWCAAIGGVATLAAWKLLAGVSTLIGARPKSLPLATSPPVPPLLAHAYFKSSATGLWLFWQRIDPINTLPKFNVVWFNGGGTSTHTSSCFGTFEQLKAMGAVVYSFDVQGVGASHGVRGESFSYETQLSDVKDFLLAIRARPTFNADLPVFFMGLSYGGALAVNATVIAQRLGVFERIGGCIPCAPGIISMDPAAMNIPAFVFSIMMWLSDILPGLRDGSGDYVKTAAGAEFFRKHHARAPWIPFYARTDPYVFDQGTTVSMFKVSTALMMAGADTVTQIRCPMLWLVTERDLFFPAAKLRPLFDSVPTKDKEFKSLADCGHTVFLDDGAGAVMRNAVCEWIAARVPGVKPVLSIE